MDSSAAPAVDLSAVHWCPVQVSPDKIMHFLVRIGDVASQLRLTDLIGTETEWHGMIVARLHVQPGKINGPAIQSARGTCFEAGQFKTT